MAITVVNTSEATNGEQSATADIDVPVGTLDGDIMFMTCLDDDNQDGITFPAGWTQYVSETGQSAMDNYIYYRVANSEPASYQLSGFRERSNGSYGRIAIVTYRETLGDTVWGVLGTPDVDFQTLGGPVNNSITSVDNCKLVYDTGCDFNYPVITAPSGMSNVYSYTGNSTDGSSSINIYNEDIVTGGVENKSCEYTSDEVFGALYYITSTPSGSPEIDDINGDDIIENNEIGCSIDYSGFQNQSGTFTLRIRSTEDANAYEDCPNLSVAAGSGTFDGPNVRLFTETAARGAPFTTANNALEAQFIETDADPDEEAFRPITRNPEANYQVVEVAGATKVAGSLFENVVGAVDDESVVYGTSLFNTVVDPDGTIYTDQLVGVQNWYLWRKNTGETERIIFVISGVEVNSVNQEQFVDQVTLSQNHTIVVNDVHQDQFVDEVVLSVVGAVTVNDVHQDQFVDQVNLTQNHKITVNDVHQDQFVDQVTLKQNHKVTVGDVHQNQFVDIVNLTQVQKVTVNNVFQEQFVDVVRVSKLEGYLAAESSINGALTFSSKVQGSEGG